MLCEVYRGYIGLGSTAIFRTAAQAAADLDQFSVDAGAFGKQGGLLTQEKVFTYSVSQGRLQELQKEVDRLGAQKNQLVAQLEGKVQALERMGVAGAGDYLKMAAKMTLSYFLPIFSVFSFAGVDIFGSGEKKKAEQLMKECEALVKQITYWNGRIAKLNSEGEALSKAVGEGAASVDVTLINVRQHKEADRRIDVKTTGGFVTGMYTQVGKKMLDTAEPTMYGQTVLQTNEELAERVKLQPAGDRLPVGFQTLYSPILSKGKIVAKVPMANTTLPNPVDRRVVYGGLLSGIGEAPPSIGLPHFLGIAGLMFLAYIYYGTDEQRWAI